MKSDKAVARDRSGVILGRCRNNFDLPPRFEELYSWDELERRILLIEKLSRVPGIIFGLNAIIMAALLTMAVL